MTWKPNPHADPHRVEIGRKNRLKWKGFTPEGLERVRQAARKTQPWKRSTGPRTPKGKAQAVLNGKRRQKGRLSVRELQAELANLDGLFQQMARCRALLAAPPDQGMA
jgi:hypothetical protein